MSNLPGYVRGFPEKKPRIFWKPFDFGVSSANSSLVGVFPIEYPTCEQSNLAWHLALERVYKDVDHLHKGLDRLLRVFDEVFVKPVRTTAESWTKEYRQEIDSLDESFREYCHDCTSSIRKISVQSKNELIRS